MIIQSGKWLDLIQEKCLLTRSSVNYEFPQTTHDHKSMLLRGVKLPTPALTPSDIEITRSKASRAGRNHGGAPLGRAGQGYGREPIHYGRGGSRGGSRGGYSGSAHNDFSRQEGYRYPSYSHGPPPPPPPGGMGFGVGAPPPPPAAHYYNGRPQGGYQGAYNNHGTRGPPPPPGTYHSGGQWNNRGRDSGSHYRGGGGRGYR